MAIFVLVAWTIQLAEYLGLVQTTPPDCKGRAYLRANEGSQWLQHHLIGAVVHEVEPRAIRYANAAGEQRLEFREDCLHHLTPSEKGMGAGSLGAQFAQPERDQVYSLGPGGSAAFTLENRRLSVELVAVDVEADCRGEHKIMMSLQVESG